MHWRRSLQKEKKKEKEKSENPPGNEETLRRTLLQNKVSLGSHQSSPDGLCRYQHSTQTSAFLSHQDGGCSLLALQTLSHLRKQGEASVKTAGTTNENFQRRQCDRKLSYKTDSAHGTHSCQLDNNFCEFSAYLLSWMSNNAMKALVIPLLYFEYMIAPFPGIFCSLDQTICYVESASVTPYPVKAIALTHFEKSATSTGQPMEDLEFDIRVISTYVSTWDYFQLRVPRPLGTLTFLTGFCFPYYMSLKMCLASHCFHSSNFQMLFPHWQLPIFLSHSQTVRHKGTEF